MTIQVIAHRGGDFKDIPPNSMAAFKKSLELGVDGIELDVQKSKDGVLMVSHDDSVGERRISDLTAEEIKQQAASYPHYGMFSILLLNLRVNRSFTLT